MSVIDKARKDFEERKDLEIPVPEWDCTVYASIATLKERRQIAKKAAGDINAAYAEAIILKAKHKDGKPMFTRDDKEALMHEVDPNIVEALAAKIAGDYSFKDAEKN